MIKELMDIADFFTQTDATLTRITKEWAYKRGITDEVFQEELEKLLKANQSENEQ